MNKSLFVPLFILSVIGLVMLSSISSRLFFLQSAWMVIGIALIPVFMFLGRAGVLATRWFAWSLYGLSVFLLLIAIFFAPEIRNTQSWVVLGPVQFQPVELAKLALILVFAGYFSRRHVSIARFRYILASFFIFIVPAALTLLQPDLGSATILFGIWIGFLFFSGLPRRWVMIFFFAFAVLSVLSWNYGLADYQKARIRAVAFPEENALGINYSVIQSKIAIGSSGFWGKGYGQGTQTQLGFLTEPATDFIFAAIVEEWGILGGIILMGAFFFLIAGIIRIGLHADTNLIKFTALGAATVFGLHFLINAGSATGLLPVVGVPFSFVSYGGSNLLASFSIIGFLYAIDNT